MTGGYLADGVTPAAAVDVAGLHHTQIGAFVSELRRDHLDRSTRYPVRQARQSRPSPAH